MDVKPDSRGPECACPTDSRIARHFDAKVAERLARGQDPGLVAVSQRLSDALLSLDPTGRTVLELGCGRGGLLLGLVQAGAARARSVSPAPASGFATATVSTSGISRSMSAPSSEHGASPAPGRRCAASELRRSIGRAIGQVLLSAP